MLAPTTAPHDEDVIKRLVRPAYAGAGVLAFDAVSRRYGASLAIDRVSFRLETGTFTALVGENGAGKTTLLRLAAGLETPTAGAIRRERRDVSWLGQEPGLYDELTVRENLAFTARLFGKAGEIPAAAAAFGIASKLDERARRLSRGERQRAALARSLLAGPLLLLDEPTTALDAQARDATIALLADLRGTRTLLVATHEPEIVKRADRVLELHRGRLAE